MVEYIDSFIQREESVEELLNWELKLQKDGIRVLIKKNGSLLN